MAHGDRLKLTEGDAFLVYIEVYGYDNVKGQTEREMYRALMRIWEEIQLANRGNKIELIQDPQEVEEDKKPAILKWFLPQEEIPSGLKWDLSMEEQQKLPGGSMAMNWKNVSGTGIPRKTDDYGSRSGRYRGSGGGGY